jgi:3-deoxy-D-manno-octulosonic acid kinase
MPNLQSNRTHPVQINTDLIHDSEGTFLLLNPDVFDEVDTAYFDASYWQKNDAIKGQEKGRGTTWFIEYNAQQLVLRHYYRGGVISKFNRDSYLYLSMKNTRAVKEYKLLQALNGLRLPVPLAVGARVKRNGLFYRADILSGRIEHAKDLVQILQTTANEALFATIGETVARFHQAKVYHPDLNIQNILVDHMQKVWLIDFDQASMGKLSTSKANSMLSRLKRSFIKEVGRHNIQFSEANWQALMRAYQAALAS